MGKKKKKFGKSDTQKFERGYMVIKPNGTPAYPLDHPEGVSEKEAKHLSNGLIIDTKVVKVKGDSE